MEEVGLQVDRRCNSYKSLRCNHGLCGEEESYPEGNKVETNCIFQYLMGSYSEKRSRLFSGENSEITRTNSPRSKREIAVEH